MVNMRVLLVKTLMKNPLSDEDVGIPLGLLYLASSIRKTNPKTEIKIFDSRLEKLNGNYNKLNKEIKKADIVCVGACTAEFSAACNILTKAKTEGKITIIGGLFPTSNAEFILNLGMFCIKDTMKGLMDGRTLKILKHLKKTGEKIGGRDGKHRISSDY